MKKMTCSCMADTINTLNIDCIHQPCTVACKNFDCISRKMSVFFFLSYFHETKNHLEQTVDCIVVIQCQLQSFVIVMKQKQSYQLSITVI